MRPAEKAVDVIADGFPGPDRIRRNKWFTHGRGLQEGARSSFTIVGRQDNAIRRGDVRSHVIYAACQLKDAVGCCLTEKSWVGRPFFVIIALSKKHDAHARPSAAEHAGSGSQVFHALGLEEAAHEKEGESPRPALLGRESLQVDSGAWKKFCSIPVHQTAPDERIAIVRILEEDSFHARKGDLVESADGSLQRAVPVENCAETRHIVDRRYPQHTRCQGTVQVRLDRVVQDDVRANLPVGAVERNSRHELLEGISPPRVKRDLPAGNPGRGDSVGVFISRRQDNDLATAGLQGPDERHSEVPNIP